VSCYVGVPVQADDPTWPGDNTSAPVAPPCPSNLPVFFPESARNLSCAALCWLTMEALSLIPAGFNDAINGVTHRASPPSSSHALPDLPYYRSETPSNVTVALPKRIHRYQRLSLGIVVNKSECPNSAALVERPFVVQRAEILQNDLNIVEEQSEDSQVSGNGGTVQL